MTHYMHSIDSQEEPTFGCSFCELGIEVERAVDGRHSRLKRWRELFVQQPIETDRREERMPLDFLETIEVLEPKRAADVTTRPYLDSVGTGAESIDSVPFKQRSKQRLCLRRQELRHRQLRSEFRR